MQLSTRLVTLLGALLLALAAPLVATAQAQQGTVASVVYQPPLRGAPAASSRVGGGVRGADGKPLTLGVLVPDHVAVSASTQPTLYWFVSDTIRSPVELTVVQPGVARPALDVWLAPPVAPGIQTLRLEDHGVTLQPGVEYRWYVAVVTDRDNRSKDVVAGGEVAVQPPGGALAARLLAAGAGERPAVYAGAGYWYDALHDLSTLGMEPPAGDGARRQRAALLEGAGLTAAAAYERERLAN